MKITHMTRESWVALAADPQQILARIDDEVFIVRGYLPEEKVAAFKAFCIGFQQGREASWHPCLDGCPDYHRIHHNYPKAHVRSIQHGYYFHGWNENAARLADFREIFALKAALAGADVAAFMANRPSEGPIARLVSHLYPRGGGGQEEHIDPVSPFAKIQTIIQASRPGIDYHVGGLYVRDAEGDVLDVDPETRCGDLIVASPGVRHGVAPIDPDQPLDWNSTAGRWIIMPIIIHSDHVKDPAIRPVRVNPT